jgi:DNA-binding NtrC family response regulator
VQPHHYPIAPSRSDRFGGLIGPSERMRALFALLERVAPSDLPVLIEGETGTGKELCAEAIAAASGRREPFVVCDLAGVSRPLIESELFGHVRGAFTGAERDRDGAFAQAHGGTLFIDEIGELEIDVQPRLLRALEQRRVKPVGAAAYRDVDARVIIATNRDLEREAAAGRFRADLYHRLAVVRVTLPPLRARKEDLPRLIAHFIGDRPVRLPPETLSLLFSHDWPGNVRELRNVLERGLSLLDQGRVLHPGLLGLAGGAPDERARDDGRAPFHREKARLIAAWERAFLLGALRAADGNVTRAAREVGLDRVHLHRLLRKHRLAAPSSVDDFHAADSPPAHEARYDGETDS